MVPGSRGPSQGQGRPGPNPSTSSSQQGGYGQPRTAPLPPDGPRDRMGHGRDMSDGTALRVTRDVLGATERGYGVVPAETAVSRMSEESARDGGGGEKEKKGWFGRRHKDKERDVPDRERKISGVSARSYGIRDGRTSPTGTFSFLQRLGWRLMGSRLGVLRDASCDVAESEPERVTCGYAAGGFSSYALWFGTDAWAIGLPYTRNRSSRGDEAAGERVLLRAGCVHEGRMCRRCVSSVIFRRICHADTL